MGTVLVVVITGVILAAIAAATLSGDPKPATGHRRRRRAPGGAPRHVDAAWSPPSHPTSIPIRVVDAPPDGARVASGPSPAGGSTRDPRAAWRVPDLPAGPEPRTWIVPDLHGDDVEELGTDPWTVTEVGTDAWAVPDGDHGTGDEPTHRWPRVRAASALVLTVVLLGGLAAGVLGLAVLVGYRALDRALG